MSYNTIYHGDVLDVIDEFDDNSIDVCITDPPYFLHRLDSQWDAVTVGSQKNMGVVTSLPSGMKFDPEQGRKFHEWWDRVAGEVWRVLKPGAFFLAFSAPRLYHQMVHATEANDFWIRDAFMWLYTMNQPKAMSLNHFIDKTKYSEEEKQSLKEQLAGWKTPQLKSAYEPIMVAQKPLRGTFLDNYREYNVGLMDTNAKVGEGKFPANLLSTGIDEELDRYFLVGKPTRIEKGETTHKTVKPLELIKHLIALTTRASQLVLDPFAGSGTTLVAAAKMKRSYVGIEINRQYVDEIELRLKETHDEI